MSNLNGASNDLFLSESMYLNYVVGFFTLHGYQIGRDYHVF